MEIFKWVKDLEETYKKLVENARKDEKSELDAMEKQQKEVIEKLIKKKQEIASMALNACAQEIKMKLKTFNASLDKAIEVIQDSFMLNKQELLDSLLTNFGFEF